MTLEEQEIGELHVFHRSIYPLVFKLIYLALIVLGANIFFDLVSSLIQADIPENYFVIRSVVTTLSLLIFGILAVYVTIRWVSDLVILDGKRIISRHGFAIVKEDVYTFSSIPTIDILRSPVGQLFNYGGIRITRLTSEGEEIVFRDMPNPEHIVRVLEKNIPPPKK